MNPNRLLGINGPRVPALGLGCMGMSEFYGETNDQQSMEVLRRAHELGVRHYDTADMYGDGHNETLLAEFMKSVPRDDLIVATKFGIRRLAEGAYERSIDNSPAYIRAASEASLKRLGVEVIDLYYIHRVDPNVPIEDTVGMLAELVTEGKIRRIGLSEVSAATLRRAHAVHPITAVQSEYSLWTRDIEAEVLPACRELGVAFVAYSPLGRGFLAANITSTDDLAENDSRRTFFPRFTDENLNQNLDQINTLREMAAARDVTPAQLALAWVLAQGDDIFAIPGTKRLRYLEQNMAAANLVLTQEDIARLNEAMPLGAAQGDRYSEAGRVGLNA